jgi:hypothetical protein
MKKICNSSLSTSIKLNSPIFCGILFAAFYISIQAKEVDRGSKNVGEIIELDFNVIPEPTEQSEISNAPLRFSAVDYSNLGFNNLYAQANPPQTQQTFPGGPPDQQGYINQVPQGQPYPANFNNAVQYPAQAPLPQNPLPLAAIGSEKSLYAFHSYRLSYMQSDRVLALLKALGYSTVEFSVGRGESINESIFSEYAQPKKISYCR